jgi:hypothetical protein
MFVVFDVLIDWRQHDVGKSLAICSTEANRHSSVGVWTMLTFMLRSDTKKPFSRQPYKWTTRARVHRLTLFVVSQRAVGKALTLILFLRCFVFLNELFTGFF